MIIPIYITTTEWGKTEIEVAIAMVPKFYHITNYDFDLKKKKNTIKYYLYYKKTSRSSNTICTKLPPEFWQV